MVYTVYGKPNCPECEKLKNFLNNRQTSYEYIDISENQDKREVLMNMGYRSVPQVFQGEQHIGGFLQTKVFLESTDF